MKKIMEIVINSNDLDVKLYLYLYKFFNKFKKVVNSTSIICYIIKRYSLTWDGKELLDLILNTDNIKAFFLQMKSNVKILYFSI